MGNSCSSGPTINIQTKHRYTVVYSPLSENALDVLSTWVQLATKYHDYANFSAINVLDASSCRAISALPPVNVRKLPVVFAYHDPGKAPTLVPFDQIGLIETELKRQTPASVLLDQRLAELKSR